MPLHPVRTTANTPAEHVSDHNAYRAEFDAPTHTHSGTYAPLDAALLQLQGEGVTDIYSRSRYSGAAQTMVAGQCHLTYFTALKTLTITKIAALSHALSASQTLVRFGLYTVAADEAVTLVAATANDATIFAANNTLYERALDTGGSLPASYQLVAGTRYAAGIIVVGGTPGTASGLTTSSIWGPVSRRLSAISNGLSDLPTSLAAGGLGGDGRQYVVRFAA